MADTATLEANKEIARSFFTAITEGRWEDAGALLDPDGGWWSLSRRAERPPLVQLDRIKGLSAESKSGMRFTVQTLTAEDDRVAALVGGYAEFEDRVYDNLYNFLLRFDGPRIAHLSMYDDTALAEKVLRGANPLPSHADK